MQEESLSPDGVVWSQNTGNGSDAKHHLVQGSANYTLQAGPIFCKVLLEHSHTRSFAYSLWLLPRYGSRAEF